MATLQPCQDLILGETPVGTEWLVLPTSTNPSHQLRLQATAAIPIGKCFTITMRVTTSYTLQASATANTVSVGVADGVGQWISGTVGSPYAIVPATLTDFITLLPNRTYTMSVIGLAAIAIGSPIINFAAKLTPTTFDYFESGMEDVVQNPKITVSTNNLGITTFTFTNYTFIQNVNIALGSFKNAKSSGVMTLTSSFGAIPSFTDAFNIYGSVLLNIRSNSNFTGSGTIIISIQGVGSTSVQGILPTTYIGGQDEAPYSRYFEDMSKLLRYLTVNFEEQEEKPSSSTKMIDY
jgi:hypothetical protein